MRSVWGQRGEESLKEHSRMRTNRKATQWSILSLTSESPGIFLGPMSRLGLPVVLDIPAYVIITNIKKNTVFPKS